MWRSRVVLIALGVIVAAPLLLVAALWARQETMIFIPDARPLGTRAGWQRETLSRPGEPDLTALLAPGRPAGAVILHFHGNGGSVEDRLELGQRLTDAGYVVVLAEYRGYGGTAGRPGEEPFARDAAAWRAWAAGRFPGRHLVLWGESLGTAVVTRLAAEASGVAGVVLESPFTSVADLARVQFPWLPIRLLLRHPFESLQYMPRLRTPVLVIASAADPITPADHARRMAAAAPDGRLVVLPGGAHPAVLNDASGLGIDAALAFIAGLDGRTDAAQP